MAFTIPNEADAAFADQAEIDSVDFVIVTAAQAGTGVVSGCAVTAQGTPDMTVAVASGTALVAGSQVAVSSGNVTISAADATHPRFDLVVVNGSGTKSAQAGTPSSNPVFPAIPANSAVLASVYVPTNDTDIDADQIVDKRVIVTTSSGAATPLSGVAKISYASADDGPISSDTALSDDAALSLVIEANSVYYFEIYWKFIATGVSGDVKFGFLVPGTTTMEWGVFAHASGGSGAPGPHHVVTTATPQAPVSESGSYSAGIQGGSAITHYALRGLIFSDATGGTVRPRWAQNASAAENLTRKAGSHLMAWRLA